MSLKSSRPASKPLTSTEIKSRLTTIHPGRRLESAFTHLYLAYISLGFAQEACRGIDEISARTLNGPLKAGLEKLSRDSKNIAIIEAAGTYDQAGAGSNSLSNALDLITGLLKNGSSKSKQESEAARQLISAIRDSVISKKSEELTVVQYWRNKSAAHSSLDPVIDPWAEANPPQLSTIRTALDQMLAAYHEFALLLDMLPETRNLVKDGARIDENSSYITFDLVGSSSWSGGQWMSIGETQGQQVVRALRSTLDAG